MILIAFAGLEVLEATLDKSVNAETKYGNIP
jgi:hypothetical protein